jgi:UDP-glucuronate 4-epimerase
VVGVDNLNDYYTPALKEARVADLRAVAKSCALGSGAFVFHRLDMMEGAALTALVLEMQPQVVIHLAAQAGVRYGAVNQVAYLESNLIGHFNILRAVKALADVGSPVRQLIYASSSSVYGNRAGDEAAFAEGDDVTHPLSLYAGTKAANEAVSHAWSHQFGTPMVGLRFFTVYGPWGRPDMTPLMFTHAAHRGTEITLFDHGNLWRDFTYIDDVVEAVVRLAYRGAVQGHEIFNIGNQAPTMMNDFVATLDAVTGVPLQVKRVGPLATEVARTSANTDKLRGAIGWAPATPLKDGLAALNGWYLRHRDLLA